MRKWLGVALSSLLLPAVAAAQAGETVVTVEVPLASEAAPARAPASPPEPTEPPTEPTEPPTVVVDVGELPVPAEEVRAAVGAELAARAVPPDARAAGTSGITVRLDAEERLVVTYVTPDGARLVRAVAASEDPRALLMAIAFLAGNLARDQVAPLLTPSAVAPAGATVGDVLEPPPVVEQVQQLDVVERASPPAVALGLDLGAGSAWVGDRWTVPFSHLEASVMVYPAGPHLSLGARGGVENLWLVVPGGPQREAAQVDLGVWYTGVVQLETQLERFAVAGSLEGGVLHPNVLRPTYVEPFDPSRNTPIAPYASVRGSVYAALVDGFELGLSAYVTTTFVPVVSDYFVREPLRFGGLLSSRVVLR